MAKKNQKVSVDLDSLDSNRETIAAEAMDKLKAVRYDGGNKKLPSLLARTMGTNMLKNLNTGEAINTLKIMTDLKTKGKNGLEIQEFVSATVGKLRKDLFRVAKANNRKDLRVRTIYKDGDDRAVFFYDVRKEKAVKETAPEKKTANGGKGKK